MIYRPIYNNNNNDIDTTTTTNVFSKAGNSCKSKLQDRNALQRTQQKSMAMQI